jgi:hypothetical protein
MAASTFQSMMSLMSRIGRPRFLFVGLSDTCGAETFRPGTGARARLRPCGLSRGLPCQLAGSGRLLEGTDVIARPGGSAVIVAVTMES